MDPYLERHWEDVHPSVITYTRDALLPYLPSDLFARMEKRVYIDTGYSPRAVRKPDVMVIERPARSTPFRSIGGTLVAPAKPILLDFASDPVEENYIQIFDADGRKVVTAIELISPGNKIEGTGRAAYLRKRDQFIASDANIVEIDLVRAGEWVSMLWPMVLPSGLHTAYRASVRRSDPHAMGELYPLPLQDRLPVIQIPLRQGEPDALLDLQALIDRAYEFGRYDSIDYTEPCEPPLTGAEAEWADQLLRAAGRRS
jgi:hypothetical protein